MREVLSFILSLTFLVGFANTMENMNWNLLGPVDELLWVQKTEG